MGAFALAACSEEKASTTTGPKTDSGATSDGGPKSDAPTSTEEIKIGVSLGLTGGLSGFSEGIQNAVRVSEDFINENGGILDKKVRFLIEDDKTSKEADLTNLIKKFIEQEKVAAIIGPLGSGQVVASHEPVKAAKIIQLSPSATSPDLSTGAVFGGTDRYFFRTVPPDDFQGKAVARFAYDGPKDAVVADGGIAGCRKMAIVYIDDAYGKTLSQVSKAEFIKRSGASVVYEKEIPTDIANFGSGVADAVVTAALAATPECQAIIMYEDVAGVYMKAFHAKKASFPSKFFTIGTDGIYTGGFLKESRLVANNETGENAATGVYGTNPDTNPAGRAEFEYFKTRYTTKYPLPPGVADIPSFTPNLFDAAVLVALAIQHAGGTSDPVKVRDSLKAVSKAPGAKFSPNQFAQAMIAAKAGTDIDYQGASGDVDFKDEGWTEAGMIIWKATQASGAAPAYETKERITADQLK